MLTPPRHSSEDVSPSSDGGSFADATSLDADLASPCGGAAAAFALGARLEAALAAPGGGDGSEGRSEGGLHAGGEGSGGAQPLSESEVTQWSALLLRAARSEGHHSGALPLSWGEGDARGAEEAAAALLGASAAPAPQNVAGAPWPPRRLACGTLVSCRMGEGAAPPLLTFGVAERLGRRAAMEDCFVALPSLRAVVRLDAGSPASPPSPAPLKSLPLQLPPPPDASMFAVFDGHGGARTARALVQRLPTALALPLLQLGGTAAPALAGACLALDGELLAGEDAHVCGSTACVVLLRPCGELLCLNVGDSRAVLCSGGAAVPLSADHTCAREDERARIRAAGGSVVKSRLGGVLAVSRAFGDAEHKRGRGRDCSGGPLAGDPCSALPDIVTRRLAPGDEFVLLASDGLWCVMTSAQAVRLARRRLLACGGDAARAAREVADKALELGSTDNVTVVLLLLSGGEEEKVGEQV